MAQEIKFKRTDKDLSVSYVNNIQKDPSFDTYSNAIEDATTLTLEEINALGYKEAKALYTEIIANTFEEDSEDSEDGKK